jgi:6-phosphogluconolactonase (cycloisomerase 2 family)
MPDLVFVGSYTAEAGGKGTGISTFRRDTRTGVLTLAGELAMPSPSWLTWHPSVPVLYAVNETEDGAVTAVALDEGGDLDVLGSAPTGGAHPCHLAVTADGRHLLCANYTGGSLAVFALDERGAIAGRTDLVRHEGTGPHAERQEAAHVHMVVPGVSADGDAIVSAVDLGTDEIRSYRLSEAAVLTPFAVSAMPPGTGPRQLVRRPGTNLAYVAGELAGTVVTVREGPPGTFTVVDTSPATTPAHADAANLAAHLEFAPDDSGLYLSNRGPDCLTAFTFDRDTPRPIADHPAGMWPRQFTVLRGQSGDGHCYVAAQNSDEVLSFTLPPPGGQAGPITRYPVGSPACVVAAPSY